MGSWSAPQSDLPELPTRRPGPPSEGFRPIGEHSLADPNQYGSPSDSAPSTAPAPGPAQTDIPPTPPQQGDNRPYLPPPPPMPSARPGETTETQPSHAPAPEPTQPSAPESAGQAPVEPPVVQQPLQRLPDLPPAPNAGPIAGAPQSGSGPSPAPGPEVPPGPVAPGPTAQAPHPAQPPVPAPGPAPQAPGPTQAPGPAQAPGPSTYAPGPNPYASAGPYQQPPAPAPYQQGPAPHTSGSYPQVPGPDPRMPGPAPRTPDPYRQWPAPQPGPAPRTDGGGPVQGYQQPPNQQWNQPAPPPHGGQWQGPPQGQPEYRPNQPGPGGPAMPGGLGSSLDDVPLRRAKRAPGSGWRKAVHHVSRGAINPGMSAEERRLQELVARIRQPVRGDYRIAVLSLKGGVGKTTTTMGLGSTFSSIRGDRVIAVDANPDFGTLSQRVPLQTRSTVRDLLLDPSIERYSDVRRHTSQSSSRLEVLASERDPAASEAFSEAEYRAVARILQRFYNIILTDCGTGLMHSAMTGVLDLAHSLVLISSPAIDGARSAAATLDWLSLHGHDHLVRNAVVVINCPRDGSPNVGIQQLREYFLTRCRAVHIIPFDNHLSEGAEIDLHRLHKSTKRAYVELAATVADDFATDHRRFQQ
uniref:MinD/ParA family ATP-binding protein n=2 Tax=Nocardia paucivorans TaxID=114259 RepID=UPI0035714ED9